MDILITAHFPKSCEINKAIECEFVKEGERAKQKKKIPFIRYIIKMKWIICDECEANEQRSH